MIALTFINQLHLVTWTDF